jgi:Fe2+ or Zn2+ uptake regulation protein
MLSFTAALKKHKLKATRQRLAVHEAMCTLIHASADEVTELIAKTSPVPISVASVYNILSQLADVHIYARRLSSNNKMYFDLDPGSRLHLYDRENHTYRDVVDEELSELVLSHLKKRRFKGFTVEDIDIQLIAKPTKKSKI